MGRLTFYRRRSPASYQVMTQERQKQIEETLAKYPHALASQGGGLVVYDEDQRVCVFVLPPDWGHYKVGDFMPSEWGTAPAAVGLVS
jgi:hypothetical protein